jgi:hypothetical protein
LPSVHPKVNHFSPFHSTTRHLSPLRLGFWEEFVPNGRLGSIRPGFRDDSDPDMTGEDETMSMKGPTGGVSGVWKAAG